LQSGYDIFIAHSGADARAAAQLFDSLRPLGLKPFLDKRELRPGDDWRMQADAALKSSRLVVVLYSKRSEPAYELWREVRLAGEAAKRIVPVLLPGARLRRVGFVLLSERHYLHLDDLRSWERVASVLGRIVSHPEATPSELREPVRAAPRSLRWLAVAALVCSIAAGLIIAGRPPDDSVPLQVGIRFNRVEGLELFVDGEQCALPCRREVAPGPHGLFLRDEEGRTTRKEIQAPAHADGWSLFLESPSEARNAAGFELAVRDWKATDLEARGAPPRVQVRHPDRLFPVCVNDEGEVYGRPPPDPDGAALYAEVARFRFEPGLGNQCIDLTEAALAEALRRPSSLPASVVMASIRGDRGICACSEGVHLPPFSALLSLEIGPDGSVVAASVDTEHEVEGGNLLHRHVRTWTLLEEATALGLRSCLQNAVSRVRFPEAKGTTYVGPTRLPVGCWLVPPRPDAQFRGVSRP
jgi:hypothetical protein